MTTMTRTEHVDWAKARAYEYIDRGDLVNGFASFVSDMGKHPEAMTPAVEMLLSAVGMQHVINRDAHGLRHFIEGFA